MAAWGRAERGDPAERAALEWLEALPPPRIDAPPAQPRSVEMVFVPDNETATLPAARLRKPRAFPAIVPAVPAAGAPALIRFVWQEASGADRHLPALAGLARHVAYLGSSHSPVRVTVSSESPAPPDESWAGRRDQVLRVPYPGRLAELEAAFADGRRPPLSTETMRVRPPAAAAPPRTLFDGEAVTVLADAGGDGPPALVAFPLVAKRLRDALMATADAEGLPIPGLISGHAPDGSVLAAPHIAIVPLADVGWPHASGRLLGIGLVWPRDVADEERRAALRIVARFLSAGGVLHFARLGVWRLESGVGDRRASLDPGRYARAERTWTTVLPAVLDRHPKPGAGRDLAAVVAASCRNLGLPEQVLDRLEIEASEHALVRGAPGSRDVAANLAPDSPYRDRPLRHLLLRFAAPVAGPLLLGAGRYRGLGLCLPLPEGRP